MVTSATNKKHYKELFQTFLIICGMFECINVYPSTTCLKMVSKYIESYRKLALAVNQRHPTEAICLLTFLSSSIQITEYTILHILMFTV